MARIPTLEQLRRWPWAALIVAMVTVVLSDFTAGAIKGDILFNEWGAWPKEHRILVAFLVGSGFILFSLALYHMREELLTPKSILEEEVTPHRCLIVPLSTPDSPGKFFEEVVGGFTIVYNGKHLLQMPIEEAIKALDGSRWNWQQFLRGIANHKKANGLGLEAVYLIGTKGTDKRPGSFEFRDKAAFLVSHYMKVKTVKCHDEAVDPEGFNALCDALNEGIAWLKDKNYTERDIVIDVTGATKVASIAGAAVTMASDVKFQYVQNAEAGTEPKVKVYDVITRPRVEGE